MVKSALTVGLALCGLVSTAAADTPLLDSLKPNSCPLHTTRGYFICRLVPKTPCEGFDEVQVYRATGVGFPELVRTVSSDPQTCPPARGAPDPSRAMEREAIIASFSPVRSKVLRRSKTSWKEGDSELQGKGGSLHLVVKGKELASSSTDPKDVLEVSWFAALEGFVVVSRSGASQARVELFAPYRVQGAGGADPVAGIDRGFGGGFVALQPDPALVGKAPPAGTQAARPGRVEWSRPFVTGACRATDGKAPVNVIIEGRVAAEPALIACAAKKGSSLLTQELQWVIDGDGAPQHTALMRATSADVADCLQSAIAPLRFALAGCHVTQIITVIAPRPAR